MFIVKLRERTVLPEERARRKRLGYSHCIAAEVREEWGKGDGGGGAELPLAKGNFPAKPIVIPSPSREK